MMAPAINRRGLLGGAGVGFIALSVGGATRYFTLREAHAARLPMSSLTAEERTCLDAMGEIMVPGASAAGLTHYIDDQLGRAPADSLLFARYLDLETPVIDFYRDGLAAVDRLARAIAARPFAALEVSVAVALVRSLLAGTATAWAPTAQAQFYTAIRNDAIDVVYGGPAGMKRLGIPVMQHAPAPSAW